MKLKKLLTGLEIQNDVSEFLECEVDLLMKKSCEMCKSGMFFCYVGNVDGYEYIGDAKAHGAKFIVTDKLTDNNIVHIIVSDVRRAMSIVAQNFFDTKDINAIGITGTNGKTTTTYIIKNILEKAGKKVGVIGTQGVMFSETFLPANLTTPDPIDLHEIFNSMKKANVDYVIMEVSAHAIALKKVEGINFVAKVLTNITEDHLDFFKDINTYAQTKLSFFNANDVQIINADDEYAQSLVSDYSNALTFGINNPSDAFAVEVTGDGTSFVLNIDDNVKNIKTHLFGKFNAYNCLGSALCCYALGVKFEHICEGLEDAKAVEGRFNVYKLSNDRKIIVDFAHTPNGLENVLKTAKKITNGKLYCIFGCGGNRDKEKRPIMGEIASLLADFCYITSDNPRFEEPLEIIAEILSGFKGYHYYCNADRKKCIEIAVKALKSDDTLIICGKGGENYLDIKGVKYPYSDFEEVEKHISLFD